MYRLTFSDNDVVREIFCKTYAEASKTKRRLLDRGIDGVEVELVFRSHAAKDIKPNPVKKRTKKEELREYRERRRAELLAAAAVS